MIKIYIFDVAKKIKNRKEIFILLRPFLVENSWEIDYKKLAEYKLETNDFEIVSKIKDASFVLIPFNINLYFKDKEYIKLIELNKELVQYNKRAYGIIGGDFGIAYKEFSNITYFRLGGFRNQLSKKNKGFPVALSDHFKRIYQKDEIIPVIKNDKPTIGFCGQASTSLKTQLKGLAIFAFENCKRFIKNPLRKDYEPLFAPSIARAKILNELEKSNAIIPNFIYRNEYRAGAKTNEERNKTTLEYYNNILQSDYVLCVRGAGNFSVRFYETLLMGKIPIFVNTNCLLPFEDKIIWKNHVVWVEWKERKNIANIVANFHANLSQEQFKEIQINNRKLWKETLSVKGMLEIITNDI